MSQDWQNVSLKVKIYNFVSLDQITFSFHFVSVSTTTKMQSVYIKLIKSYAVQKYAY